MPLARCPGWDMDPGCCWQGTKRRPPEAMPLCELGGSELTTKPTQSATVEIQMCGQSRAFEKGLGQSGHSSMPHWPSM